MIKQLDTLKKLDEWIKSKLLRPLNEYPIGKFLPFKSKNGYYMYLYSIIRGGVDIYYYTDLSSENWEKAYIIQNDNTIDPSDLEPFTMDINKPI